MGTNLGSTGRGFISWLGTAS